MALFTAASLCAGDNALLHSSSLTALQNQSGATAAELITADTWGEGGGGIYLPQPPALPFFLHELWEEEADRKGEVTETRLIT